MAAKKWKIDIPKDAAVDKKNYILNGKKYARVTRTLGVISKPGLLIWFQKVGKREAERVVKKRQVLGTKFHKLAELLLKDEEIILSMSEDTDAVEIREDFKMFLSFKKEAVLKPEGLEQKLWSNKFNYAGTCDYIGKYKTPVSCLKRGHKARFEKSSLVIGDWKTSAGIYPEYWLQLAAYSWAFYELTGIKVKGAFIAQFRYGKTKIEERTWNELMIEFETYKHVLGLYKWRYKNG